MNFGRIDFSASLVFQNDVAEGGWVTKIHVENPNIFAKMEESQSGPLNDGPGLYFG
jgi:hypothetical protein